MGDGFEVGVEDAALFVGVGAVAVALGRGIEAVGEFILCFWGAASLALQYDNLVFVEGISDEVEVVVCGYHVNGI